MLEIKNLSKSYAGMAALKNINVKFEKGKIYGASVTRERANRPWCAV